MRYWAPPSSWSDEKKKETTQSRIFSGEWWGATKMDGYFSKLVKDEDGNINEYYDYDGNKISNETCIHRWKCEGGYGSWNKDQKCGAVDKDNNIIVPFDFYESCHIDYFLRGFVVTGKKGKYGVTTRDGKVLLPEKYQRITIEKDFIIATYNNENNWNVIDELYTLDGTPVFTDTYRRVCIDGDKFTRETPFGLEHYKIAHKNNK